MNMNELKALEKNEKLKLFQTIRRCGSRAYLRSAFKVTFINNYTWISTL